MDWHEGPCPIFVVEISSGNISRSCYLSVNRKTYSLRSLGVYIIKKPIPIFFQAPKISTFFKPTTICNDWKKKLDSKWKYVYLLQFVYFLSISCQFWHTEHARDSIRWCLSLNMPRSVASMACMEKENV